eukprot:363993-Chlamydomonas_euryale.AAC.8
MGESGEHVLADRVSLQIPYWRAYHTYATDLHNQIISCDAAQRFGPHSCLSFPTDHSQARPGFLGAARGMLFQTLPRQAAFRLQPQVQPRRWALRPWMCPGSARSASPEVPPAGCLSPPASSAA